MSINKTVILHIVWIVLVLLWCGYIFSNSLTPAEQSSEKSQGVLETVEEIIHKYDEDVELSHHFVRKAAHFIEFFVLGVLLSLSGTVWSSSLSRLMLHSAAAGLIIALIDETLQLFVKGRDSSVVDVWLDFSAVIVAHLLFFVFVIIVKRIKHEKSL